jgi:wyosine [tRNA(Phe)-imidazoG37] synthetase (radical SAM superfamily)
MSRRYLFGPVSSRRLGRSLGVDLIPYKTCPYDCVYCECGPTTSHTSRRREYVPTYEVIAELDQFLSTSPGLDFITFSGSGEPTLHIGLGEIIGFLKRRYPEYRVAVLTNAALLSDPAVRSALLHADVVAPSLDAVSDDVFRKIDRPCPGISITDIISGLCKFRREFSGEIWLEIFIVPGINDSLSGLEQFCRVIAAISPDRVQLNTLDRPGTEPWVSPATQESLQAIALLFKNCRAEVDALTSSPVSESLDEIRDAPGNVLPEGSFTGEEIRRDWRLS